MKGGIVKRTLLVLIMFAAVFVYVQPSVARHSFGSTYNVPRAVPAVTGRA
jgi:hypothetical protein